MAHHDSLIQLNALLEEFSLRLEVQVLANSVHLFVKNSVVGCRCHNAREQVVSDTIVKRNIILSKLWQVDIVEGTKTNLVLGPVKLSTQVTASSEDSLKRAHSEVIVILGRKLL